MAKKEQIEKELKVKERVDKLLEGIELKTKDKKVVTDRVALLEKNNNDTWLEEQVDSLSKENDELKTKLAAAMDETKQAKEDYKKLHSQKIEKGDIPASAPVASTGMNKQQLSKIKVLFRELENNYLGKNQQNVKHTDVKIIYLLNKFLDVFPELKNK